MSLTGAKRLICDFNIQNLTDAEYDKWYSLMSEDKKQRVDRFRFVDDKRRTVTGEMIVRKAIAEFCGVVPESIVFGEKEHGKPFAEGLTVEFNISHSGDMVVCVVDDTPVGIDIEQIRPIDLKAAKRICTDAELIYIFGTTPMEQDFIFTTDIKILTRFFELWTAKEANAKRKGIGVAALKAPVSKTLKPILLTDLLFRYR